MHTHVHTNRLTKRHTYETHGHTLVRLTKSHSCKDAHVQRCSVIRKVIIVPFLYPVLDWHHSKRYSTVEHPLYSLSVYPMGLNLRFSKIMSELKRDSPMMSDRSLKGADAQQSQTHNKDMPGQELLLTSVFHKASAPAKQSKRHAMQSCPSKSTTLYESQVERCWKILLNTPIIQSRNRSIYIYLPLLHE